MIEKKKSKLFIYFRKILMGLTLFIGAIGLFNVKTHAFDSSLNGTASGIMGNPYADFTISSYVGNEQFLMNYDLNAYEISFDSLLNEIEQVITYEINQSYLTMRLEYASEHWHNQNFGTEMYWIYSFLDTLTFYNNGGTEFHFDNFNLYVGGPNDDWYEFYDNGLHFYFNNSNGLYDSNSTDDYYMQESITFKLEYRNQVSRELVSENIIINNFVEFNEYGFEFNLIEIVYDFLKENYRSVEDYDRIYNGYFNISDLDIYLKFYDITSPNTYYNFNLNIDYMLIDKGYRIPNINTYAGQIQDTLNVDFTTWISTATNGFLNFELVPGLSIIGILSIIVSFSMLVLIIKFFGGHG